MIKYINLVLKNPFRNKTRSALSIIGIAIGITIIVALGLITGGLQDSVQTTMNEGGAEITVSSNTTNVSASSQLDSSYIDTLSNITGVIDTAGVMSVSNSTTSQGGGVQFGRGNGMSMYGIDGDKLYLEGINNIDGSIYKNATNEVIIGKHLAQEENKSIGDTLSFSGNEFIIVGIYETGSMMKDKCAYTSLSEVENLTGSDGLSQILVKTSESANNTNIADNIEAQHSDLVTITSEEQAQMMSKIVDMVNMVSLAISALAIIIGGIGIINTMIMSVYERTKEIGVLKAVGWKSKRILLMILGETVVLTLVAAVVGTILGVVIPELGIFVLGQGIEFSLVYGVNTFLLAFGVAILVGIIGGIFPAYKASRLAPTEALRYD